MTDRLTPSVEDAAWLHNVLIASAQYLRGGHPAHCRLCWSEAANVENAALALDMALAAASDARRAEDDRLRSEVAW